MDQADEGMPITEAWEEHRRYLRDLAFRMLGNISDAEDMVQEAFVRLVRADVGAIDDVRGWLVVVVSRLCLDHLGSARVRREQLPGAHIEADPAGPPASVDPADRVTLDEHVGLALLVVLQQLSPAERAAFVLHDVFQFEFTEVADIVGRTPAACRQLATRARRRIESQTDPARFRIEPAEQRRVAERFMAACAGGDLHALMELLDDDVAGQADLGPDIPSPVVRGRERVAARLQALFGPASGVVFVSQPVNGEAGVLAFVDQRLRAVIIMRTKDERIVHFHAIAEPRQLALLEGQLGLVR